MALPISRNTNYVASSPIKSVDLNDIQDAIIALNDKINNGKHGDKTLIICPTNLVTIFAGAQPVYNSTGGMTFADSTTAVFGIPLHLGDRIKSVVFTVTGGGGTITSSSINRITNNAFPTALGTGAPITPGGPTAEFLTIDTTDTVLVSGDYIYGLLSANAADITIHAIHVLYDHP